MHYTDTVDAYLHTIEHSRPLTREREINLFIRYRHGDEAAREELIVSNLRFVVSIASQYQNRGLSMEELIAHGNMGLITAVDRFDHTLGFKLITYSVAWIRQAIQQALGQERAPRVPMSQVNDLRKLRTARKELMGEDGDTTPDRAVLMEHTGLTIGRLENALLLDRFSVASLDVPPERYEDDGPPLLDLLADDEPAADEQLDASGLRQMLADAITDLTEREQSILRDYFGLAGEHPMTLDAIGERHGLTRERIRQLRDRALLTLRETLTPKEQRELLTALHEEVFAS